MTKARLSSATRRTAFPFSSLDLTPDSAARKHPVATRVGGRVVNCFSVQDSASKVSARNRIVGERSSSGP